MCNIKYLLKNIIQILNYENWFILYLELIKIYYNILKL